MSFNPKALRGLLSGLDEAIREGSAKCPKCGKPTSGLLRANGAFKGRGDFSHGGSYYKATSYQTKDEAGLCTCGSGTDEERL